MRLRPVLFYAHLKISDATHIPTAQEQEIFYTTFPDARFYNFIQKGNLLSDTLQDGKSFRYALIHLGAQNTQELAEKFEHAKQLLPYRFAKS